MNVVIYARYSCSNQREESIEGQLKVCYKYAQDNNYNVVAEYIDRAMSGTTDRRPEFKRMIIDSKKRQFEGVLVYQLNRFSRDRYDSANNKAILKKNGVKVISACERISDDASGVLMESVLEGMAEYYSKELSQKVIRGMNINATKCISNGGTIPLGFYIDENKKYQINSETAPIVVRIFEMYSNGYTMKEIIDFLNARGYKTVKGNQFNKNSLSRILTNKKYIGYISRIEKDKGWDTYLHLIKELVDDNLINDYKFLLVGSGDEEFAMNSLIDKLDIRKYLDIRGFVNQEELVNLYNCLEVFIFPTRRKSDSLGLVGLEAMSCKTIVLTGDKYGPTDYIKDNIIYFAIGLVLMCGVVFIMYYFDTTIKSSDVIENKVGLTVIGIVPEEKNRG